MDNRLKELRISKGYTQSDMTQMLGLKHKSHYNQIENGGITVSLKMAKKISEIFNKSIEDIFFDNKVHEERTKEIV